MSDRVALAAERIALGVARGEVAPDEARVMLAALQLRMEAAELAELRREVEQMAGRLEPNE